MFDHTMVVVVVQMDIRMPYEHVQIHDVIVVLHMVVVMLRGVRVVRHTVVAVLHTEVAVLHMYYDLVVRCVYY